MIEKITTLPFLGIRIGKKLETEKVKKILHNIPTDNLTELNEEIYMGAKVNSDKTVIPLRSPKNGN